MTSIGIGSSSPRRPRRGSSSAVSRPAGGLELYQGCSKLLQTSDRAGNGSEEIIRSLPAGTYGVRLVGSATPETANHTLIIKPLGAAAGVLTYRARVEGSTLRLVGEVYNNTLDEAWSGHRHGQAVRHPRHAPRDAQHEGPAALPVDPHPSAVHDRRTEAGRL